MAITDWHRLTGRLHQAEAVLVPHTVACLNKSTQPGQETDLAAVMSGATHVDEMKSTLNRRVILATRAAHNRAQ